MAAARGEIYVRSALPSDLPGLQRVAQETWRDTYAGRVPDDDIERFLEANYSLEALERMRERRARAGRGEEMLVALDGDAVVGYVTAGMNRDGNAEIFAIYVLPGLHGRGAGYRLWQSIAAHFREQGFERCMLWVLDSNERARAFYERQGGRVAGERPYPIGEAEIRELRYEFVLDDSS